MIDKCCEMLEEGIYTKEKYLTRVNILENDLKALKVALNDLKSTNFDESDNIIKTIPKLELVLNEYWNLDSEQKNRLLINSLSTLSLIFMDNLALTKFNTELIIMNCEYTISIVNKTLRYLFGITKSKKAEYIPVDIIPKM